MYVKTPASELTKRLIYDLGESAETISLLVIGGILLVLYAINEMYTKRSAIIPPRLFKACVLPFLSAGS